MADDILSCEDSDSPLNEEELLAASGLAREELAELVEFGVFETAEGAAGWSFRARVVHQARRAVKLRDAFGINAPGMALALTYLERIDTLERRLKELECLLPR